MFKSILQDIGTYVGVLMSIPKSGKLMSTMPGYSHENHAIYS
jgi:hypothetical protein